MSQAFLTVFVAVFSLILAPAARAQVIVGNGGDLIQCVPSTENQFSGHYTLDFVATYDPAVSYVIPDVADSLAAAGAVLARTPMGPLFATYKKDMIDQLRTGLPDYFRTNIWKPAYIGLNDLSDSYLYEKIPANCKKPAGEPMLIQTVIHDNRPSARIFTYDPEALALVRDRPLQDSMIFVHEFLWQFAPNARILRDANRFLHEQASASLSPGQLLVALRSIGLVLDDTTIPRPITRLNIDSLDVSGIDFGEVTVFWDIGFELQLVNRADGLFEIVYFIEDTTAPGGYQAHRNIIMAPEGSIYGPHLGRIWGRSPGYVSLQQMIIETIDGVPHMVRNGLPQKILRLTAP